MKSDRQTYPEQFTPAPDLLHVAIPRLEIIAEMNARGDHQALNDVCLAVAMVADAIGLAGRFAHRVTGGPAVNAPASSACASRRRPSAPR